ncbi:MAG: carboxypeptidase-like regulatory domain-containing protein [Myxococcales bacterium]
MRTRIFVGGLALGAVALVSWYLLGPGASAPTASSPAPAPEPAPAAAPARQSSALLTAELPAAKGALSIRGRVLGPKGPVAGAVVVATADGGEEDLSEVESRCDLRCGSKLLDLACPESAAQLVELAATRRGESPPLARATSAADGTYSLEGLEEGAFTLWVEKPGELVGLERGVRAGAESADVKAGAGIVLRGRTVTDHDRPVAGASVTAIFAASTRFFDTVSGSDGTFTLGPVPRRELTVVASAPGLLPAATRSASNSSHLRKLVLSAPRRLGGKVLREEEPVPGVSVTLESGHRRTEVAAGNGGAFVFPGLRPGRSGLVASDGTAQARESVVLEAGKDILDVSLRLGPGGELVGSVRSASGRPVADAQVQVGSRTARAQQRAGPDGRYRIAALPPGKYRVQVEADHFLETDPREVEIAEGATATADFTLEDASPIEGVVVDEAGQPLEDAQIQVRHASTLQPRDDDPPLVMRGLWGNATTKRDGTFSVDQTRAGRFELNVSHPSHADRKLEVTAPARNLRVALPGGIELSGIVLDDEDRPVAAARVTALPEHEPGEDPRLRRPGSLKLFEGTDASGEFVIRGLESGSYRVTAFHGDSRADQRSAGRRGAGLGGGDARLQGGHRRRSPGRRAAGRAGGGDRPGGPGVAGVGEDRGPGADLRAGDGRGAQRERRRVQPPDAGAVHPVAAQGRRRPFGAAGAAVGAGDRRARAEAGGGDAELVPDLPATQADEEVRQPPALLTRRRAPPRRGGP